MGNTKIGLEHEELTGKIIGAAIEVHKELGPGFLESIYEAVRRIEDIHFVVLRSYLKAARLAHGLLLNFAAPTLGIKRVVARATHPSQHPTSGL